MRVNTNIETYSDVRLSINVEDEILKAVQEQELHDEKLLAEPYPAKLHARRVVKELDVTNGVIFISGQESKNYPDSDNAIPFRQSRYFYYLTGFSYPDCAVTYDISSSSTTLWIPFVEPRKALYLGSPPTPAHILSHYDVDSVRYTSELEEFLALTASTTNFYCLRPTASAARADSKSLLPAMDRARLHKTPYEIAAIRKACQVSSVGHRRIAENLLRMKNEREIEAVFQAVCTTRGAKHMAYAPIAGSGPNAATLHYDDNDQPLAGRALVVVDAGCEFECYASDITRTLPLTGRFAGKAKEIYSIVEEMQEYCIKHCVPGKPYYQLHVAAADIAIHRLLDLGILKGSFGDNKRAGSASAFFPHGLGHHIGLEVHDVEGDRGLLRTTNETFTPKLKRKLIGVKEMQDMHIMQGMDDMFQEVRGRQFLEPGMVVTIEPGIYFCQPYLEGNFLEHPVLKHLINWEKVKEYYPVGGVRIEDVLLLTENGNENLSTGAPKGQELEDVINGGTGV